MPRRYTSSARLLLSAISILLGGSTAHATDISWINVSGGMFSTISNWSDIPLLPDRAPGPNDIAHFGLTADTGFFIQRIYTVSFTTDPTNQALVIEDDWVTFDLDGHVYLATAANPITIGTTSTRTGGLTITDGNVGATASSNLFLGAGGNGFLTVTTGGLLAGSAMDISVGGFERMGTLTVNNGGDIIADGVFIGTQTLGAAPASTATITGAGSALVATQLAVGTNGDGTLNITAGGAVESASGIIGDFGADHGTATVDGPGSRWINSGSMTVGVSGFGHLNITGGGRVSNANAVIGVTPGGTGVGSGTVVVAGENSEWSTDFGLDVGVAGTGRLSIIDGGYVEDVIGVIARSNGAVGTVVVEGVGSEWMHSQQMYVGFEGEGTLNINAGGLVQNPVGTVGLRGTGVVNVDGDNSLWHNSFFLTIGSGNNTAGHGTLNLTDGGDVTCNSDVLIADFSGSTGIVTVAGNGSALSAGGRLFIGVTSGATEGGAGTLRIQPGGTVFVDDEILLGDGDELHLEGGTLRTLEIDFIGVSEPFFWTSGTLHVGTYHGNLTASQRRHPRAR